MPLLLPVAPQRAYFDSAEFFLKKEGKQPADTLPLAGDSCPEVLPVKLLFQGLEPATKSPNRSSLAS